MYLRLNKISMISYNSMKCNNKKSNGSIQRLKNICTASGHDWLKGTEFEKIKTENSDWDAFFKIIEKLFVENTTICLKFLSITL